MLCSYGFARHHWSFPSSFSSSGAHFSFVLYQDNPCDAYCLPPTSEGWGNVMFLVLCVNLFTGWERAPFLLHREIPPPPPRKNQVRKDRNLPSPGLGVRAVGLDWRLSCFLKLFSTWNMAQYRVNLHQTTKNSNSYKGLFYYTCYISNYQNITYLTT